MKNEIHPKEYRKVIFHDISSEEDFIMSSTISSEKTKKWEDGKEYPLVDVEISSASHPFYTGNEKRLDTAGRAEKFKKRAEKSTKAPKAKKVTKKKIEEAPESKDTEETK